ncbi:hypothetical protein Taro_049372 [Colocasia esculenta]|uniref:Retrotransposon gag domain-containing protein n=1 Tax=Colocasia esculenta TaxID=4460 RepID=A0A843XAW9_COLES|nr:hypothetical protein [Colocasia esculenta]
MVGVVLRLGRTSIGVRRGVSSRPQHPRVPQYFFHHHLWITACSCKAWFRQCRPRRRLRWHYRPSCRLRLRLQLPSLMSMAMERADVWWASVLHTRYEDGAIEVTWSEFTRLFRAKFIPKHIHDKIEKAKKFVMGLKPSLRSRLVAFEHRTLDEALSTACRQESEMDQYLEEKRAAQKRSAPPFQRLPQTPTGCSERNASPSSGSGSSSSDMETKKASSPSPSLAAESRVEAEELEIPLSVHTPAGTVATKKCIPSLHVCIEDRGLFGCFYLLKMKDYDAILGLDWLEEHYALVDCTGKNITFRIPVEDEFSHPLPRNLAENL